MPEKRLERILERLDLTIDYAVKMPLAFMHSRGDAENFIVQMLGIRAIACGSSFEKMGWTEWLAGRYPETASPDRAIYKTTEHKYPHDDAARAKMFTEEMEVMVRELKEEMDNGKE